MNGRVMICKIDVPHTQVVELRKIDYYAFDEGRVMVNLLEE
jgi:hypothetical protein